MMYGVVVALLAAGAAHFFDRGLRSLGRPTRWVWVGALVAGGLAPFFPRLVPAGAPEASAGGFSRPVEFFYEVGTLEVVGSSGSSAFPLGLEESLAALWILGSVIVLMVFLGAWLRLYRQRRSHPPYRGTGWITAY
jgi:hypothetical protein